MYSLRAIIFNCVMVSAILAVGCFYSGVAVGLSDTELSNKTAYDKGFDAGVNHVQNAINAMNKVKKANGQKIIELNTEYSKELQEDIKKRKQKLLAYFSAEDIKIIDNAAERNNLGEQHYTLLYAIRKAENGGENLEFGIMNPQANTFDKQAGWCAATIQKNYDRWIKAGKPDDFITFLGNRYCPTTGNLSKAEIALNKHWIPNVKHWVKILNGRK